MQSSYGSLPDRTTGSPPGEHGDDPSETFGGHRDDPWCRAFAPGGQEFTAPAEPVRTEPGTVRAAGAHLEAQRCPALREPRRRHRSFVVPAVAVFLAWYVAYVVAATRAPALMARPVAGALNVAMLAGLGQFLTTFLLTWAFARHARLRRDRAALELREQPGTDA